MDAQQFLAEFGHIANAPGGVGKLRELVLHLAVSGKLTVQVVGEEAGDLFDDIKATQASLQSDGTIRVNRKIRSEKNQGAWQIPQNWLWCRFGELCSFSAGKTPSPKEGKYWNTGDYPWFSIADMSHGQVVTSSSETVSEDARAEVFKAGPSPAGSLLMSFKLSIGKLSLLGVPAYHNEAIITIEPFEPELKEYFFKCLNGFDLSAGNKAAIKGNTLNQDSLSNIFVALPPKNEISRIVAKVDELMALCDKLEAQQQARRTLQNALRQSTLQALASAQSPHELQTSWQRLQTHFGRLFSEPKDVGQLRDLILQLAVQGLLTQQADSDEPAENQLSEIRRISSQIAEANVGRRKRSVAYRQVEEDELNHKTPKGWVLARLGELVRVLNGRAYSKPELLNKGTPVLRVGNLFTSKDWYYSNLELEADKYCDKGDLLYAWSASFGPFIWDGPKVIFHYHIWKLNLFSEVNLCKEFLYLVLQERTAAIKSSGHGISMAHMTKEKMEQLPIALPPLDEQNRIVLRVSGLMRFCDEIEEQLSDSGIFAGRLAAAAVSALTGIAIEQEEEPMKAPQTELIAPLRLGIAPDIKAQAPLATILARHHGEMSAKDLWQRFGGEIDVFYAQLKTEVAHGWILEPAPAEMREKPANTVSA